MQEVETQGVHFTNILGDNASVKNAGKTTPLLPNEKSSLSDIAPRKINEGENTVIVGAKTFVSLGDSTKYPDPYTSITALPNSEFKITVKPWEFIDKAEGERTSGFKITHIELIKGIFHILTGSDIKAKEIKFIFPKRNGTVKIELTQSAAYIGGNEVKISGPFSKTPLNVTQFSEYIIIGDKFYKKSMLAMNEENRMDERFMSIDTILGKFGSSAMNIGQYKDSDKVYAQMDNAAQSFDPNNIIKGFETAMNMTPEMLKGAGLSDEQMKQMTEGLAKFKKKMTPETMGGLKNAVGKIKKEDMIKANQSAKTMSQLAPKSADVVKDFEALVPYGRLPGKAGECEEAEY